MKNTLKQIEMKYKLAKRSKKRYSLEYEHMKEKMGWQSPPSLDGSLSEESNTNQQENDEKPSSSEDISSDECSE